MNRVDCQHPSAFCLMTFQTPARDAEETVWNSRDMAVPAKIPVGQIDLDHVDAHRDQFRPFHVPRVGSRMWIDPVLDKAEASAEAFFALHQHDKGFAGQFGQSPREALAKLVTIQLNTMAQDGAVLPAPVLVTVTPELAAQIQARLAKRGIR